jgi:hypothetical protein
MRVKAMKERDENDRERDRETDRERRNRASKKGTGCGGAKHLEIALPLQPKAHHIYQFTMMPQLGSMAQRHATKLPAIGMTQPHVESR